MEIIKKGRPPEERVFRGTCSHCKTEFRCKKSEGKYEFYQRDGEFLRVKCPLEACGRETFAYPEKDE